MDCPKANCLNYVMLLWILDFDKVYSQLEGKKNGAFPMLFLCL